MYNLLDEIIQKTGSLGSDQNFGQYCRRNAFTTTANCLVADTTPGNLKHPLFDPHKFGVFSGIDKKLGLEFLAGGRCIAGEPQVWKSLKDNLRTHVNQGERVVEELREKLNWVWGQLRTFCGELDRLRDPARRNCVISEDELPQERSAANSPPSQAPSIDIKEVLVRTLQWVTIYLGRFHYQLGRGDLKHMDLLLAKGVISQQVHRLMLNLLKYTQLARFQAHYKAKKEADKLFVTRDLWPCLRSLSALLAISEEWLKAGGWARSFLTETPKDYNHTELTRAAHAKLLDY
jgi:hypothetical protein